MKVKIIKYDNKIQAHICQCPVCGEELFTVTRDGRYICYACGKQGNVQVNGNVILQNSEDKNELIESLKDLYDDAVRFYHNELIKTNNPGFEYFKKRGMENHLAKFGLGYAPDGFTNLYDYLKKKGYNNKVLEASKLFKINKFGNPYDIFRNRVIFPIFNEENRCIAFSGRILTDDKDQPKYINSPETEIFHKRSTLYGFPYFKKERSSGIIICEGNMDMLSMKKVGIMDSAACCGTALTIEHLKLIAKHYKHVFLAMDTDNAGIYSAKKSIALIKEAGLTVSVVSFAPYKDPDEMINKAGKDALIQRIKNSQNEKLFRLQNSSNPDEMIDVLLETI